MDHVNGGLDVGLGTWLVSESARLESRTEDVDRQIPGVLDKRLPGTRCPTAEMSSDPFSWEQPGEVLLDKHRPNKLPGDRITVDRASEEPRHFKRGFRRPPRESAHIWGRVP